jgi:hypothetical protein
LSNDSKELSTLIFGPEFMVPKTMDVSWAVSLSLRERQSGADGLVSSGGRKCPAGEIQVCERQQREYLGPILGDAAITHLAIADPPPLKWSDLNYVF